MELLLNLLWLLVSLGVCASWQFRWRHDRRHPYSQTAAAIALACLVVLLFFPISLTDDLHSDLTLAGEVSTKRKASSALIDAGSHDSHHIVAVQQGPGVAFAAGFVDPMVVRFCGRIGESIILIPVSAPRRLSGRSPPFRLNS